MRPPRCGFLLPALLAIAALAGASPAAAATITWNNPAGGVWHTVSNWTPQQVPDSTSDVVIALAGTYTVTLGAPASVKSVSFGGGSGTLTLTTSGSPTLAIAESSTVMAGGTVHFNGFVINGAGRLHVAANAALLVTGGVHPLPISNAGTLTAQGNPDLNGAFTSLAGSTLRMVAGSGGGTLDFAGGFVNRGTIEVTSSGCACFSELNVLSGTLVNEAGASISILAGAGGARSLDAQLDNRGTLTIGATTEIRRASSDHLNSGTLAVSGGNLTLIQETTTPSFVNTGAITVAAGRTFTVSNGGFQHAAGSITGAGTMSFTNGASVTLSAAFTPAVLSLAGSTLALDLPLSTATTALAMSGGTLNGPATLTNAAAVTTSLTSATLNAPLVNKGTLNLFNTTNINGSFQADAGSTLRVYGVSSGGPTTFAQAFTNLGAIELTSTGCACTGTLNGVAIVNEAGATLTVAAGAGGSRALNALLDNRGTITIGIATSVTRAGADHLNSGTLALSGGNLNIVQSGTTPSFTNTGAITIGAGHALTISGSGSFGHSAGSITGAGTLALSGATAAVTAPIAPAALSLTSTTLNLTPSLGTGTVALSLSSSTLNGPGTVTNAAGKSVSLVGSTLNAPFVNHGQLHVFGGSTIGGALTTHPGSLIRVNAGIGGAFATVTPSWTNFGTLELTSNGGGFAPRDPASARLDAGTYLLELAGGRHGAFRGLLHAFGEERHPLLPFALAAHRVEPVVVLAAMLLEVEAEVEERLAEHAVLAEEQRDQQATDRGDPATRHAAAPRLQSLAPPRSRMNRQVRRLADLLNQRGQEDLAPSPGRLPRTPSSPCPHTTDSSRESRASGGCDMPGPVNHEADPLEHRHHPNVWPWRDSGRGRTRGRVSRPPANSRRAESGR